MMEQTEVILNKLKEKLNTHIVIKREDALKYLTEVELQSLESILSAICEGRSKDGKEPDNQYFVCNLDEPYSGIVYGVILCGEACKKDYNESSLYDAFPTGTSCDGCLDDVKED